MSADFIPVVSGVTLGQAEALFIQPSINATAILGTVGGIDITTSDLIETHRRIDTNSVTTPLTITGTGGVQIWVDQDASGLITLPSGDKIGSVALPSGVATFLLISPQVIVTRVWMVAVVTAIP